MASEQPKFDVTASEVRWNGRVVKGADAQTFRVLRGAVAVDASSVWFGAKAQKADAATFEVLGTHYARDAQSVFYGLETKLKPVKGADAATFEALGSYYGRDAGSAYFKDRRLRLAKNAGGSLARLREIGAPFASDGGALYHAHQRIQLKNESKDAPQELPTLDLVRARVRAFQYNEINCPSLLFSDGAVTLWRTASNRWYEAQGIDVDAAEELTCVGDWRSRFLWDGAALFCAGARIEVPAGGAPRLVGSDVAESGQRVYFGPDVLEGFAPGELRWVQDGHYQTKDGSVVFGPDGTGERFPRPPVPGLRDALQALLGPAAEVFASIADRYLPMETSPSDFEYDAAPPGGTVGLEVLDADATAARLRVGDEVFDGPAGGLLGLLTSAWSRARGRSDRLLVYAGYGWMGPHADALATHLARAFTAEWGDVVAALHRAGAVDCATLLLHRGVEATERDPELSAKLFARVPFELSDRARSVSQASTIEKTTNFGVVKLMAEPDAFGSDDPRARTERALITAQAALDCNKKDRAVPLAIDALLGALERPMGAAEREAFLCALEMTCVAATVASDMGDGFPYEALRRGAEALLGREVMVDVNRVRLVEACFGLGDDAGAERAGAELLEGAPPDRALPGPYAYRAKYTSPALAALGARARALPARAARGADIAAAVDAIRADLATERERGPADEATALALASIEHDLERV